LRKVTQQGDSVKEVLNIDVSFIEMVVITLLITYIIAIWDQLCAGWVSLLYEIGNVELT